MALVALVPAFAFSAILLQRNNEAQERVVEALITGSARSIMQAVDREVNANITTLKILATTPTLQNGDVEAFYDQVKKALSGTKTYVYGLDKNMMVVFSTRQAYGAPSVKAADPGSAPDPSTRRENVSPPSVDRKKPMPPGYW